MGVEDSAAFLARLKRFEGTRRKDGLHVAYRCPAGALTIGWGHNLDASPVDGVTEDARIDDAQAEALLKQDVREAARALDARFPWWRGLDEARGGVLLDMAFNMGAARLSTFRRTLEAVRGGRFKEAARAMLDSRWASQVGRRAVELAETMRSGLWG